MPTFRQDTKIGTKVPMMKTDDYNDQSVTKDKIRDGNITSEKLAEGAVSADKLSDGAVSTSKIASRSVTNEKIAYNSVSRAELTPEVRSSIDKKADAEQVNNSLYDLEKKIGDRFIVEGDVTNLPDEEDLTSVKEPERDVLKLADRSYTPKNFSGKGYKILRKNIKPVSIAVTKIVVSSVPTSDGYLAFIINGVESHVDVVASTDTTTDKVAENIATKLKVTMSEYDVSKSASTITLTRKFCGVISTPSSFSAVNTGALCSITDSTKKELRNIIIPIMMNQPNTIYEVRYDFDLDGETIEMQEGCTLKFEGGSLRNGGLKGDNTSIIEQSKVLIGISLMGTFSNSRFQVESFGAVGNGLSDDTLPIQSAIDNANQVRVPLVFTNKYKVVQIAFSDNDYYFHNAVIIQSKSIACLVNEKIDNFGSGAKYTNINSLQDAIDNNDVNSIKFYGNLTLQKATDYQIVSLEEQLKYKGFRWNDGNILADSPVNFAGLYNSYIEGVRIEYSTRTMNMNIGFSILTLVRNSVLSNGIDNCLQLFHSIQCTVQNCNFINGGGGILVMQGCVLCSFSDNSLLYSQTIKGVNQYIISIKDSENCSVVNNSIYCSRIFQDTIGICVNTQISSGYNSSGIIVAHNKLKNCGIGIVVENTYNCMIVNNMLDRCAYQQGKGDILIIKAYNILIQGNTFQHYVIGDTDLYNGIIINSGNYINILYNSFREFGNKILVLFRGNNTETSVYKILGNFCHNKKMEGYGIFIETSSIFKYDYISNNNFENVYNQIFIPNGYKRERLTDYGYEETWDRNPTSASQGYMFFSLKRNTPMFFNGSEFLKANVESLDAYHSGTTAETPSKNLGNGYQYYDVNKMKLLIYNQNKKKWFNADGSQDYVKSGPTSNRPAFTEYIEGFTFYDTDLKKMILWNGTDWVNMDGTEL